PLSRVLSPAIELARHGFRLGRYQARTIEWAFADLAEDPVARGIFGAAGKPRREGSLFVQPELAATLERIAAQGDAGFYTGETASQIAALGARGGLVTAGDL